MLKLVCDYEKCKLLLESPVVLVCAKTVCKEHLGQFENSGKSFKCICCDKEHSVPEDGFQVNTICKK